LAHDDLSVDLPDLPNQAHRTFTAPIARFLHIEAASGFVLLMATAAALVAANSPYGDAFLGFWKIKVGFSIGDFEMTHSLRHWVDDGLMAIFFFVVGLEVKREMVVGELREARRAALPIVAAFGGMVVPAGIYLALQSGGEAPQGWGIPMATDIAFVVGCMAVLGPRVPHALRVMLLSLAIVDDIGAILVIAIGYTESIDLFWLIFGFGGIALTLLMSYLGFRSVALYCVVGVSVWYGFHESGVHATIAGVILGLATPARQHVPDHLLGTMLQRVREQVTGTDIDESGSRDATLRRMEIAAREAVSPLTRLETLLHPWVGFLIMPIFALANAGVRVEVSDFGEPIALAVMAGLVIGKPVGVVLFSWLAVRVGVAILPRGLSWGVITGGGFLAGIGFTMALFIANLALDNSTIDEAKVGILGASAIAAVIGMTLLTFLLPKAPKSS
jgi:NhaA family Na+:H+ antiporter